MFRRFDLVVSPELVRHDEKGRNNTEESSKADNCNKWDGQEGFRSIEWLLNAKDTFRSHTRPELTDQVANSFRERRSSSEEGILSMVLRKGRKDVVLFDGGHDIVINNRTKEVCLNRICERIFVSRAKLPLGNTEVWEYIEFIQIRTKESKESEPDPPSTTRIPDSRMIRVE